MTILNELTGYKSAYNKTFEQVIKTLTDLYGTKVYAGNFGMVLAPEGKDYVYKIFHEDPAFEEYFKFCTKNQQLSFVPKLKDKRIHTMKLPTIRDISHADAVIKIVKLPKLYKIENEDLKPLIKLDGHPDGWIKNFFMSAVDGFNQNNQKLMDQYLTDEGKKFFDDIVKSGLFYIGEFSNDINPSNIMKTLDGTLILTDPLWTTDGVKPIKNLEDTGVTTSYSPTDKIVTVFGKNGELVDPQTNTDTHILTVKVSDHQLKLISKLGVRDISKLKDDQIYVILDKSISYTLGYIEPAGMPFIQNLAVANRITLKKYIHELPKTAYNKVKEQLTGKISQKLLNYIFDK